MQTPAYRLDVQTLRAIAVVAVFIFHLWPGWLPGGFIGVDVFFVISGFLIVTHLVREIDDTGRIRLLRFWTRRARRLLPAALLVLALTAAAVVAVVPLNLWPQYMREVIASALYGQNWMLAFNSTDYMAQHNTASPVQHFWSLSVEEQFYIVTPLILIAVAAIQRGRRALLVAIAVLTIASLAFSIWFTIDNPPAAYFNTGTRAWEFGVGALVGFVPAFRRGWIAWAGGAAMVVASLFVITGATPFPSWTALLPVVGTALMLAGGQTLGGLRQVVENRVGVFVGGISYSVYLWHWPAIVLLPYVTGHPLTTLEKVAIIAGTIVVAYASTRWVEDPIRNSPRLLGGARRPWTVTAWSAAGMAAVIAVAGAGIVHFDQRRAQALAPVVVEDPDCFGAPAALHPDDCEPVKTITPDPAFAAQDGWNDAACWSGGEDPSFNLCSYGPEDAEVRLAAFGDSHSNGLMTAYRDIAESRGWRIDVSGHTGCFWMAAVQLKPTVGMQTGCEGWKDGLRAHLAASAPYDGILVTNQRETSMPAPQGFLDAWDVITQGLIDDWQVEIDRGVEVIAIRDVPSLRDDVVTCMVTTRDAAACSSPEAEAMGPRDPLVEAAAATDAHLIDFTDIYCTAGVCSPVVGGVMAYSDKDHLTGTFVGTLAPLLEAEIATILEK